VQANPSPWVAVAAAIIIGREIAVSSLREWMAEIGDRTSVAVSTMGKVKTVVQMIAVLMLLYQEPFKAFLVYEAGLVLLYVAAALTIWSMVLYLKAAWPTFSK